MLGGEPLPDRGISGQDADAERGWPVTDKLDARYVSRCDEGNRAHAEAMVEAVPRGADVRVNSAGQARTTLP